MGDDLTKIHRPGDSIGNGWSRRGDTDGSLGCFARFQDGSVVVLSCAHVLFAHYHTTNLSIYSPAPTSSCCKHDHIADALNTWDDGFGRKISIRPSGTDSDGKPWDPDTGYEIDCAIARMRSGYLYTNEIPKIGMISGTPPSGFGITAPTDLAAPSSDQIVRFFSKQLNRVQYGVVISPPFSGTYVDSGQPLDPLRWTTGGDADREDDVKAMIGVLLVMPIPAPGESLKPYLRGTRKLFFAQFGDSGSVVVNSQNQVIGLICRAGDKPRRPDLDHYDAWKAVSSTTQLCPIGPVLAQMKVTIPASLAKTTPSAGEMLELQSEDPEASALRAGQRRVGAQLQRSRLGKIILEKLRRRGREAQRILARDRRAQALWQHYQGPAFVNHCIRNLRDPSHRVPTMINGMSRAQLLRVMADVLAEHGGPDMRRDIERYRELVLAHAPQLRSLDDVAPVIATLGTREPIERA